MTVPLLVFLHGLGQTPQLWQDQVTSLPAGTRAVAPWLDGLRPGRMGEPFDLGRAADAVLAQLNRFGVDQVALCGCGLGAMVATEAAIRSPSAVSHLVLVGGQVRSPRMLSGLQRLALRAMPASRFADAGVDRARLAAVMGAVAKVDFRRTLDKITARTLVVAGAEDALGLQAARQLASGIAGARLEVVADAGAQVNLEAPQEFNRLLYETLAG